MSGFVALMQPRTVLISMAPDTTEGREERAVQTCLRTSQAATLGRTGLAPHLWKQPGDRVLYLTLAAK